MEVEKRFRKSKKGGEGEREEARRKCVVEMSKAGHIHLQIHHNKTCYSALLKIQKIKLT